MAELRFIVLADLLLHLTPVTLIIPDFLAILADGHNTTQCHDFIQCILEASAFFFKRLFRLLALGDVAVGSPSSDIFALGRMYLCAGMANPTCFSGFGNNAEFHVVKFFLSMNPIKVAIANRQIQSLALSVISRYFSSLSRIAFSVRMDSASDCSSSRILCFTVDASSIGSKLFLMHFSSKASLS